MVVIIGITASVLFLILWKSGFLDDLQKGKLNRRDRSDFRERKRLKDKSTDPEMNKRLEIFKEFIDELPDDEGEE